MSNKKATKRALLTSILAICLCLVMLIGSTFAWFTDTASTGVNTIQAGTLKVDIVDTTDAQNSLKGKMLKFVQMTENNGLTTPENGVRWEPGATFRTEEFRIKNAGSLALKWKMNISGGITTKGDAASNFNLLNVITFYIVKKTDTGTEKVDLAAFEGQLSKQTLSDVYYLEGTMDTTAGNDYQGLSLDGVAITVYVSIKATNKNAMVGALAASHANDIIDRNVAEACIENVHVKNVTILGDGKYVGGLIGYSGNNIINCSVETGSVTGSNSVGALIGFVDSFTAKIEDCTVSGIKLTNNAAEETVCTRIGYIAGRTNLTGGNTLTVIRFTETNIAVGDEPVTEPFGKNEVGVPSKN